MLRDVLSRFSRPLSRLLLRTVSLDDPWQRFPNDVPLALYGKGAQRDFSWYFEGESRVPVTGVDEMLAWLRGCAYVRDMELFHDVDFWQHPLTFEQLRRGDCEDFALWSWRKLVEMGHDAEFVAGRCAARGLHGPGHAWVLLHGPDGVSLLDPVLRNGCGCLRPLDDVRDAYVPEVSVDGRLNRYAYAGFYLLRRSGSEAAPPAEAAPEASALLTSAPM